MVGEDLLIAGRATGRRHQKRPDQLPPRALSLRFRSEPIDPDRACVEVGEVLSLVLAQLFPSEQSPENLRPVTSAALLEADKPEIRLESPVSIEGTDVRLQESFGEND